MSDICIPKKRIRVRKKQLNDLLEFCFTKIVHWEVIGDTKRIETDVITNVSLQVLWVGKKWNCRALLCVQSSSLGSWKKSLVDEICKSLKLRYSLDSKHGLTRLRRSECSSSANKGGKNGGLHC